MGKASVNKSDTTNMENEKRQHKPYVLELNKVYRDVLLAFSAGDIDKLQKGLVNMQESIARFQKVIVSGVEE